MTDTGTPADDRTAESADMITDAPESDPADLSETAADETVDQMHGEVDTIAEEAAPDAPGHGATE